MKNILFILIACMSCFNVALAEAGKDCTIAQDTAAARLARKELSFYAPSRTIPRVMYFIKIDKKHYERTLVKKMKVDTSAQFMACYNKIYQPVLDSVFKCDFFRKVDSITADYDDRGMGYRASQFRGGQDSLNIWLNKNIVLPVSASPDDSDTHIRVYYFGQIDSKGNVIEMKFSKTNCKICEPVVTDAFKKLPPFVPATQAGVPTKSTYILPFSRKTK
jgi:hypothetical protein